MQVYKAFSSSAKEDLKSGGVGVLPTDTIYGITASALNKDAVERIYDIKSRNENKPFIILISSIMDLIRFGIGISANQQKAIEENWPGPVSIILDAEDDDLEYLHRGTKSLAFRLPKSSPLVDFIKETGPLVAPSANPEGMPPAESIEDAIKYFGDKVDFYIDGGVMHGKPSKLIRIDSGGEIEILRN